MYVYHGTVWSLHQVPQRWKWQSLDILVVVGPTWTSSRFCWDSSDHPERESGCYAWHPYAMIPWCFAYDRLNYARYLPYYYTQMSQQPTTHPDVHAEFMRGGFSVQFGSTNPFGRIPDDQTIKQTTNKDRQTPGDQGVQFETRGCEQILLYRRVYGRIYENVEGYDRSRQFQTASS